MGSVLSLKKKLGFMAGAVSGWAGGAAAGAGRLVLPVELAGAGLEAGRFCPAACTAAFSLACPVLWPATCPITCSAASASSSSGVIRDRATFSRASFCSAMLRSSLLSCVGVPLIILSLGASLLREPEAGLGPLVRYYFQTARLACSGVTFLDCMDLDCSLRRKAMTLSFGPSA